MTVDFRASLPRGQSLSSGCTADPSEAEMSDSDNDDPSVRKIVARSKSIIDLTLGDDDDSAGDKNSIEVSWLTITRTAQHNVRLIPPIPLTAPRPSQIEIAVSDDDLESYQFPKECPPKGAYTKLSPYRYRSGPRGTHSGPRGVYSNPRVPIQALGVPIQALGVPT
jgi:hypothetical protein